MSQGLKIFLGTALALGVAGTMTFAQRGGFSGKDGGAGHGVFDSDKPEAIRRALDDRDRDRRDRSVQEKSVSSDSSSSGNK